MNILAGVVSYEPDVKLLNECVQSVLNSVEKVIIVDNSLNQKNEVFENFKDNHNVSLIQNERNVGISKALNQIFQYAQDNYFDYVLCLDQDSVLPANVMTLYALAINENQDRRIGIICPRIHDRLTNKTWPADVEGEKYVLVNRCITSGSLNSVEIWNELGGFDEYLFIDEVDHDYSYRVIQRGYSIIMCNDVIIDHQIGDTKIVFFCGIPLYVRNHKAFRKYYIVRNMIYIGKKHYGRIRLRDICHAMLFTLKTLVFENDKRNKFRACCKGFRDGIL